MTAHADDPLARRILLPHEFGFAYDRAVLEINRCWSYEQIAEFCGYENKASIARIAAGTVPSHPTGEALYILYVEMFGRKPPLRCEKVAQSKRAAST